MPCSIVVTVKPSLAWIRRGLHLPNTKRHVSILNDERYTELNRATSKVLDHGNTVSHRSFLGLRPLLRRQLRRHENRSCTPRHENGGHKDLGYATSLYILGLT